MTPEPITVGMDDTVEKVREVFDAKKFHHLPVVEPPGPNGVCVGVISDRDLLKNLSPFVGKWAERREDANLLQRRVHQIMSRELVSVTPQTPAAEGVISMLNQRISCLPVLDERRRCVGIVTKWDVLAFTLQHLQGGPSAAA